MHSMASCIVAVQLCFRGFSPRKLKNSVTATVLPHTLSDPRPSYNALVFQAARLLGPPARFEASKLEVLFMGEKVITPARIAPRTYTISHCDFMANLTLTISNIIHRDKVLEAVIYGDANLFRNHQELMNAAVKSIFSFELIQVQSYGMLGTPQGCSSGQRNGEDKWIRICEQGKF